MSSKAMRCRHPDCPRGLFFTRSASLAAALMIMMVIRDSFRHTLGDLGGGLGMTDPVSGTAAAELPPGSREPKWLAARYLGVRFLIAASSTSMPQPGASGSIRQPSSNVGTER